jgi:hypothetical protein
MKIPSIYETIKSQVFNGNAEHDEALGFLEELATQNPDISTSVLVGTCFNAEDTLRICRSLGL